MINCEKKLTLIPTNGLDPLEKVSRSSAAQYSIIQSDQFVPELICSINTANFDDALTFAKFVAGGYACELEVARDMLRKVRVTIEVEDRRLYLYESDILVPDHASDDDVERLIEQLAPNGELELEFSEYTDDEYVFTRYATVKDKSIDDNGLANKGDRCIYSAYKMDEDGEWNNA